MTNDILIQKFNPANGANVTAEDLETLRGLTDQQIETLAKAYPNTPGRRSYLRLFDTTMSAGKQLYPLSTWQNLNNVRKYSNRKNLIPYDFFTTAANFTKQQRAQVQSVKATAGSPKKVLVDLTAKEAADELRKSVEVQKSENLTAAKTATSPVKGGRNKDKAAPAAPAAPVVENPAIPADQQFGAGE